MSSRQTATGKKDKKKKVKGKQNKKKTPTKNNIGLKQRKAVLQKTKKAFAKALKELKKIK